jgi:hypothetical protein
LSLIVASQPYSLWEKNLFWQKKIVRQEKYSLAVFNAICNANFVAMHVRKTKILKVIILAPLCKSLIVHCSRDVWAFIASQPTISDLHKGASMTTINILVCIIELKYCNMYMW